MTGGHLMRIAGRTLGVDPVARPRAGSLFEPVAHAGRPELRSGLSLAPEGAERNAVTGPLHRTAEAIEVEPGARPELSDESDPGRRPTPLVRRIPQAAQVSIDRHEEGATVSPHISAPTGTNSPVEAPHEARRPTTRRPRGGEPAAQWPSPETPPDPLVAMPSEPGDLGLQPAAAVTPLVPPAPEQPPDIKVTIGRIEVRAPAAAAAKAPRPSRLLSLDDYLNPRRNRA